MPRLSMVSGMLRVLAVGFGGAAISVLMQQPPAGPLGQPEATGIDPSPRVASPAAPRTWAVRAAGWYVRVDGAEIALPSVVEQMTSRPQAGPTFSISPFDQLIAYHAHAEGFDWRLIAALIFEESRFNPTSRSDKGAYGLMQVRPIAAAAVGATEFKTPYDNVQTGVRYLRQLEAIFSAARDRDRLKLVLAAYSMGPGHLQDAQSLARRFGHDPNRWDDAMDVILPLLELPEFYVHLPYGYADGRQTVTYVERIIKRYHEYQRGSFSTADGRPFSPPSKD